MVYDLFANSTETSETESNSYNRTFISTFLILFSTFLISSSFYHVSYFISCIVTIFTTFYMVLGTNLEGLELIARRIKKAMKILERS